MLNVNAIEHSWNIFIDPNTDPEYFYSKIKQLSLIVDRIYIFSPHDSKIETVDNLTPDEFLKFHKNTDIIRPVISTEWNNPSKRKDHPHKDFRTYSEFDKTLYKNEKKFYRLKNSENIRNAGKEIARRISESNPALVDKIAKLHTKDLQKIQKLYPNVKPKNLPDNLDTVLPTKIYQKQFDKNNISNEILYEFATNLQVLQEVNKNIVPYTKKQWFEFYRTAIDENAEALTVIGKNNINKETIQTFNSIVSDIILNAIKIPELDLESLEIKTIQKYRNKNGHKSIQRWIMSCMKNSYQKSADFEKTLMKETRLLTKRIEGDIAACYAVALEAVCVLTASLVYSQISGNELLHKVLGAAGTYISMKGGIVEPKIQPFKPEIESKIAECLQVLTPIKKNKWAYHIYAFRNGLFHAK